MTAVAQGCHELGISQKQNSVCKKGEPGRLLPVSTEHYTKNIPFCKYSNVTKIGKKISEKAYEVEFYGYFDVFF